MPTLLNDQKSPAEYAHPRETSPRLFYLGLIVTFAAFFALLSIFWVGFWGSDDALYWAGSNGWLRHFPYLPVDHWSLRHTLVIPIVIFRLLLGNQIAALFLPSILYASGTIAIIYIWVWRSAGITAALITVLFFFTNPQVLIYASTADVDLPELFFVICAFWIFSRALEIVSDRNIEFQSSTKSHWVYLVAVGALLGFGMLSRETTIFAVATMLVLFLAGYGIARREYFLIALGCFLIVGLETLYLDAMSGHLFFRANIDVHHDLTINRRLDQGAAIPLINPVVDPLTMIFLNHNFGLISWIGIPLSVWLAKRKDLTPSIKRMVILLGTLTCVWTLCAACLWTLLPLIPRYYLLPSCGVSILAGLAVARLNLQGRKSLSYAFAAVLVTGNLVAISADNRQFMFGEHQLVKFASQFHGKIYTDKETLRRATLLLDFAGTGKTVSSQAPHAGSVYFYNPIHNPPHFIVPPNWHVLATIPIPPTFGHSLVCRLPKIIVPKEMLGKRQCTENKLIIYAL